MIHTTFIKANETYFLRQSILRPGRPVEESIYAEDTLPTTFHIGTYEQSNLMAITTWISQSPPASLEKFLNLSTNTQSYRLRGMATDPSARRKGYGRRTVVFAEAEFLKRDIQLLWFNARQIAYPFYTSLGYEFFGDEFEVSLIGPHKVMYKLLKSDNL
jgi:GNAT superfamily N-acetyltransferase